MSGGLRAKIEALEKSWREATGAIERYREQGNLPMIKITEGRADWFAGELRKFQEMERMQ